jgi:PAS domain S-box-containing protein
MTGQDPVLERVAGVGEEADARFFTQVEKALRGMAERGGQMLFMADMDGRLRWVNSSFRSVTGRAGSSPVGMRLGEVLGSDHDPIADAHDPDDSGIMFDGDLGCTRPDGTRYWLNIQLMAIDHGRDEERIAGHASDITEMKSAVELADQLMQEAQSMAEAYAWSQNAFEMVLHGADLGEWQWTVGGTHLECNTAWLAVQGVLLEDGRPELYWMDADARAAFEGLGASGDTDERAEIEIRVDPSVAADTWLLARGRPVEFDGSGRPSTFMGTFIDISERKWMERELRDEKQLIGNVLSTIPHGVYWMTEDGVYLGCNQTFADLVDLEVPDLVGRTDGDLPWRGDTIEGKPQRDRLVIESGEPLVDSEVVVERADGSTTSLLVSRVPLSLGDDGSSGLLGVFSDVTKIRELEAQLAAGSRLEAVGQLAAGIAHEINTPMQYIGDNVQFLVKAFDRLRGIVDELNQLMAGPVTDRDTRLAGLAEMMTAGKIEFVLNRVPRALEQSIDGVGTVARIVRAMKDFSHPGTESKHGVDLNAAIATTIEVCKNEWKYVAEVECDLDESLPLVTCFPGEINQVILNLIVNAAHAIADHRGAGGRIGITTQVDGSDLVMTVSDNGGGIPPEVAERVFEPFFTTKEVGRGSGQGLAICRQIVVKHHGGTIYFRTNPGAGTTFEVRLPLTPGVREVE